MKAQTKIIIGAATIAALLIYRKVNNAEFDTEWKRYKAAYAAEKEEAEKEAEKIEEEISEQNKDLFGETFQNLEDEKASAVLNLEDPLPDVNFII